MQLIKFEKSTIELKVKGCNIERTLNFLCSKNIEILGVKKTDFKNVTIKIKPKDYIFVTNYLKERKFEIEEEKNHGLHKAFVFFLKRWGTLLGCFLAIAFMIISSNFLLKIEVLGNANLKSSEIIKVLEENDISTLKNLNNISTKQVEEVISTNFDDVSLVSVVKKGCSLIINIKEKLKNEEFENLNNLSPLYATEDGMIKEINLIQGTLCVSPGQIVKKGDVLVLPYTTDSAGKQIPITPKAEIIAEVWINGVSAHSESEMIKSRTGKYVLNRETSLCGIPIFSNNQENIFKEYEVEVRENYLSSNILPIKYKETFYFETKCDIINIEFDAVKEQKINEAKNDAYSKVDENLKIIDEKQSISENLGNFLITYTITAEKDITK